jgi:hypothetical protein
MNMAPADVLGLAFGLSEVALGTALFVAGLPGVRHLPRQLAFARRRDAADRAEAPWSEWR